MTDRLQRFGYVDVTDRTGLAFPAHEFHHAVAEPLQEIPRAFRVRRAGGRGEPWECGYERESALAGFPHLHFGAHPELIERLWKMMHGGNVWRGGSPASWLDFSANLRPEGPPDWAFSAMCAALLDARYYPDVQMTEARRGIARYAGVPEACALPTSGGIAAIEAALRAGRGGRSSRRRRSPSTRDARGLWAGGVGSGLWRDARGRSGLPRNPNNPTGAALERDEVLALHARARKRARG
jgi:hypothetical protein